MGLFVYTQKGVHNFHGGFTRYRNYRAKIQNQCDFGFFCFIVKNILANEGTISHILPIFCQFMVE